MLEGAVQLTVTCVSPALPPTPVGAPGTVAGQAAVLKVTSEPLVVPALFTPLTRKWYVVLQLRSVRAAETAVPEASAASVLCAAVAELP